MKPQSAGSPRRRKKAPRRDKAPKKKKKSIEPSAAARAIRAGHRPPPKDSSGLSLFTVLLLLVALGIGYLIVMVMIPKDLSSIDGYPPDGDDKKAARNLLRESLDTLVAHDQKLVVSEEDMNRYLRKRVVGKQGGVMGSFMKFEGVVVDFKDDHAEAYVLRSVFGYPFSMSCKVTKGEKFKGRYNWELGRGGSIGSLNVPGRQLQPIIKVFSNLATICKHDLEIMNKISKSGSIEFEEDKMILNPRK